MSLSLVTFASIALCALPLAGLAFAGNTGAAEAEWKKNASGLEIQELKVGEGTEAKAGNTVDVHYTGWLLDGTKFDSSVDRGKVFSFRLGAGEVIRGWDEGVAGMKVGTIAAFIMEPILGAGGVIPGNATLIFDVELLGVR